MRCLIANRNEVGRLALRCSVLILLLTTASFQAAGAQENGDIVIEQIGERPREANAEMNLRMRVTNNLNEAITIESIELRLEAAVVLDSTTRGSQINEAFRQTVIEAGKTKEFSVKVSGFSFWDSDDFWQMATFRGGEYSDSYLMVAYYYDLDDGSLKNDSKEIPVTLELLAPIEGVILGAVLGVILIVLLRELVVFLQARSAKAGGPEKSQGPISWKDVLRQIVGVLSQLGANTVRIGATLLLGFIAVTFFVLIARLTETEFELPLLVGVRDFGGGLLVGVLYKPVTDWLFKISQTEANQ